MTNALVCWKCGESLASLPLPLGRLAECEACGADLHVCRLCEFYDPRVSKSCREPIAEEVKDKERANFCDYFNPRAGAYIAGDDSQARAAQAQLDALFGRGTDQAACSESAATEAEVAQEKLEQLFRLGQEKKD